MKTRDEGIGVCHCRDVPVVVLSGLKYGLASSSQLELTVVFKTLISLLQIWASTRRYHMIVLKMSLTHKR